LFGLRWRFVGEFWIGVKKGFHNSFSGCKVRGNQPSIIARHECQP
jgi:hypothetical protein